MERFTAEDAFDASECGEPIVINRLWADKVIASHGAEYDAATVLAWLGY